MKMLLASALGGVSALALATSAQAASLDLTPALNAAISDFAAPVCLAVAPTVAAILVMPLRRFLDQRAGSDLALRVNDLLDKAIAFGAAKAQDWVTEKDFHATVDGGITDIAADYALAHAPDLMKRAGAAVAPKSAQFVKDQADQLLREKIVARLSSHPDVAAVKAMAAAAAPVQLHPVAAAA